MNLLFYLYRLYGVLYLLLYTFFFTSLWCTELTTLLPSLLFTENTLSIPSLISMLYLNYYSIYTFSMVHRICFGTSSSSVFNSWRGINLVEKYFKKLEKSDEFFLSLKIQNIKIITREHFNYHVFLWKNSL